VGLGADWLPSGSVSLLDEIQVARRILRQQRTRIEPDDLVKVVTSQAAEIADLDDHLGRIAEGRPADLLVLERLHENPYESICRSNRTAIELVAINGKLVYGRDAWFKDIVPEAKVFGRNAPSATGERVWAWGKPMRIDLGSRADPADLGHEPPFPRRFFAPNCSTATAESGRSSRRFMARKAARCSTMQAEPTVTGWFARAFCGETVGAY
jgi:hypothetical protein